MLIDFKNVRFSLRDKQVKRRRRLILIFAFLLLAAGLGVGFSYLSARRSFAVAQRELLAGRFSSARQRIARRPFSLMLSSDWQELSALDDLLAGRPEAGRVKFLGLKKPSSRVDHFSFCNYFSERAEYRSLEVYSDYLRVLGSDPVLWYQALSQAARLDGRGAAAALGRLSPSFRREKSKEIVRLERVLEGLNRGRLDYIFDRRGIPLAYYDASSRATRALVPGIGFSPFEREFAKGVRFFSLALDGDLQRRVASLFSSYFGTFVLLDAKEAAILVAYSKPRKPSEENAAWSETYEPGSIIKMLTLLAYLTLPGQELFPFRCQGVMEIEGRLFADPLPHENVSDFVKATALSCNLSFARMGMAAGSARMAEVLERFSFNGPPFEDLFLSFPTGRFQAVGESPYRLASLSVGLREVSITTLHAAVVASVLSGEGACHSPFLVERVKNILDLGIYNHPQSQGREAADPGVLRKARQAMEAAVEDENGTARRARVDGLRVGAKTGTAGKREEGLDAILIGFFPAEFPQYAFAFRLEGGGRAEFKGASLLRDFLQMMRSR